MCILASIKMIRYLVNVFSIYYNNCYFIYPLIFCSEIFFFLVCVTCYLIFETYKCQFFQKNFFPEVTIYFTKNDKLAKFTHLLLY